MAGWKWTAEGKKEPPFQLIQSHPIRKSFFQHTATPISNRTQTNVQQPFLISTCRCELAVQLSFFVKTSVLRQHEGYPFAPIQILTGDTRKGCAFRCGRLHDDRRSFPRKSCIERRFESRSQDGVVSLKHGRLAHVRSQFSLFRRSPTHKNLPLATFCTSEQKVCPCRDGTLRVLFCRP